jgi:hypothetical protein
MKSITNNGVFKNRRLSSSNITPRVNENHLFDVIEKGECT